MQVEIDHDMLIVKLPIENPPELSSTGKTRIIATTRGTVQSEAVFGGKRVSINLNAFVYASTNRRPKAGDK